MLFNLSSCDTDRCWHFRWLLSHADESEQLSHHSGHEIVECEGLSGQVVPAE